MHASPTRLTGIATLAMLASAALAPATHAGDCSDFARAVRSPTVTQDLATEIARRHDAHVRAVIEPRSAEALAALPRSVELGAVLAREAARRTAPTPFGDAGRERRLEDASILELTARLGRAADRSEPAALQALAVLDDLARDGCLSATFAAAARELHARVTSGQVRTTAAYGDALHQAFGPGRWSGLEAFAAAVLVAVGESSAELWTATELGQALGDDVPKILSDVVDADAFGAAAGALIGGMTGVGLGLIGSAGAGPLAPLLAGVTMGAGAKAGAAVGGATVGAAFSIASAFGDDEPEPVGDEPGGAGSNESSGGSDTGSSGDGGGSQGGGSQGGDSGTAG